MRIRIGQMNKEIILNQTLWELPKREKMLKDWKYKGITYQKVLLRIKKPSSIEKTFMNNPLIPI